MKLRSFLEGKDNKVGRRIIRFLIHLYNKQIWRGNKLINFIADGINLKDNTTNLIVSRFLINVEDPEDKEDDDSDDENLKDLT
jgi:hypothetical protein